MRNLKRILSLLLVLLMLVSLIPVSAFAELPGEQEEASSLCEHTPGEAVSESETEPTCTEPGSHDEVVYCSLCGEELSRETVEDPAPGHMPEDAEAVASTCEKHGHTAGKVCSVCEAVLEGCDELPLAEHTPGEAVIENEVKPTCTEPGSHDEAVYCTVCEKELSRETVTDPALGHKPEDVEEVPAGIDKPGVKAGKKCAVCGAILEGCEAIEALPEETVSEEKEPEEKRIRVSFSFEPKEAEITVYAAVELEEEPAESEARGEKPEKKWTVALDENDEPVVIEPEDDGTYLLLPGTYLYDAACEDYESVEKEELTVEEPAEDEGKTGEEPTRTVEIELKKTEDAPKDERVRVSFACTPKETEITVYEAVENEDAEEPADEEDGDAESDEPDEYGEDVDPDTQVENTESKGKWTAARDENGEPIVIKPEEDGTYLLLPGTYLYDARCAGYMSVEKAVLTVEEPAEGEDEQKVPVELSAARRSMAKGALLGASNGWSALSIDNATTAEITARMEEIRAQIGDGSHYWNNNGRSYNNCKSDIESGRYDLSTTLSACNGERSPHNENGTGCTSNTFYQYSNSAAYQCQGFANYMWYALFGQQRHLDGVHAFRLYGSSASEVTQLMPGDVVQQSEGNSSFHWYMVWKVVGDDLYVADCNRGTNCKIQFSKYGKTASDVLSRIQNGTDYLNRPKCNLTNGGSSSTTGSTYSTNDALSYANSNYLNYSGNSRCSEFVMDCLWQGGLKDVYGTQGINASTLSEAKSGQAKDTGTLYRYLISKGFSIEDYYDNGGNLAYVWGTGGNSWRTTIKNGAVANPGDVVFYYKIGGNKENPRHAVICYESGSNSKQDQVYSVTPAFKNKVSYYAPGVEENYGVFVVHINSSSSTTILTPITVKNVCAKNGNHTGSAVTSVDNDKAIVYGTVNYGNDNKPDYFNLYIGTSSSQLTKATLKSGINSFTDSVLNSNYPDCNFWAEWGSGEVVSPALEAGTTYYFKFEIVSRSGTSYWSEVKSFKTNGTAPTYTVSYNANGGTGAPGSQTKTYAVDLTLSSTKPTRANSSAGSYTVTLNANGGSVSQSTLTASRTTSYSFKNWNTKADGTGSSYASGGSYTANAAVTLYAQWNTSTTTAAVTLPTPTRSGYTFKGWGTSSTATSGVTGSYTPSGNVTLYALWEASKFRLDLNGFLDGVRQDDISGYGTADIYINGSLVSSCVSDYCKEWPNGTRYEIKNIQANHGHVYTGVNSGSLSGTINNGEANVRLSFSTSAASGNKINFHAQEGTLGQATRSRTIDGINTKRTEGQLVVYNDPANRILCNSYGIEIAVDSSGAIAAIRQYGDENQLAIPSGGFILSGHGTGIAHAGYSFLEGLEIGQYISLDYVGSMAYAYSNFNDYLTSNKYVNSGEAYGTLPEPVRDAFSFDGWYTAAEGGSKIVPTSTYSTSDLYAHWNSVQKPDIPTVSSDKSSYAVGETVTITWTESAGNDWYWINVYKDGELTVNQSMGKAQSYTMTNAEAGSYVIWLSANNSAGQKGHGECAFTVGEVSGVKINSTNFPDDIARGLILENLDKDHNTYLSDAEIAAVTELDINDLGISDLKGIEYFTELTHLDCAGNRLTELDVSHNTKLVSLLVGYLHDGSGVSVTHSGEAHGNQLTTLDLSQNHALKYVMCAENRLTSLNLSGCTNLEAIWCYDNQLTALDLSDCASLTGLYCSNNRISTLNLSGHTALEALVCWDNSLATLFVSGCSALSYISCGGNQLTALDLSSCAALEELYVSYEIQDDNGNYQTHGNRLTALDLSHNPALKEVQCYGNQLSSLNVSGCSKLEGLYCSNNQLTGLNLSGCAALNELYCFGNRLSELNLSGCRNLHALQCFGNTQLATLNISSAPALLELMNAVEPTVYSDAIVYQSEDALLSYDPAIQLLTTGGLSIYALTNNQSILVKFDTVKSGCGNISNYVITDSSGQIVPLSYAGDAQGETGVANTYKLNFPDPLPADTYTIATQNDCGSCEFVISLHLSTYRIVNNRNVIIQLNEPIIGCTTAENYEFHTLDGEVIPITSAVSAFAEIGGEAPNVFRLTTAKTLQPGTTYVVETRGMSWNGEPCQGTIGYFTMEDLPESAGLSIYALTNNQSILVRFDNAVSGAGNKTNYVVTNSSGQIVPLSYAGNAQGETGVANTYKLNFPDPLPADVYHIATQNMGEECACDFEISLNLTVYRFVDANNVIIQLNEPIIGCTTAENYVFHTLAGEEIRITSAVSAFVEIGGEAPNVFRLTTAKALQRGTTYVVETRGMSWNGKPCQGTIAYITP